MFISGYSPSMTLQQTNQSILSSMNSANLNSNIIALGNSDKKLGMRHAQCETMDSCDYASEQQAISVEKKYWQNRRQAIQNGYLF